MNATTKQLVEVSALRIAQMRELRQIKAVGMEEIADVVVRLLLAFAGEWACADGQEAILALAERFDIDPWDVAGRPIGSWDAYRSAAARS